MSGGPPVVGRALGGLGVEPLRVTWRHMFIDVDISQDVGVGPPMARAHSAPPPGLGRCDAEDLFRAEIEYVEALPMRLRRFGADLLAATPSKEAAASASKGAFAEAGEEAPTNAGSEGHPHLCSRPCLYFASGSCANRESCGYCHAEHPKRGAQLSRKHREVLQAMPAPVSKAFVLPLLHRKVLDIDPSEDTRRALDVLEGAWAAGVAPAARPAAHARGHRALGGALNAMALRPMLSALQLTVFARELGAASAAEALLQQLRAATR